MAWAKPRAAISSTLYVLVRNFSAFTLKPDFLHRSRVYVLDPVSSSSWVKSQLLSQSSTTTAHGLMKFTTTWFSFSGFSSSRNRAVLFSFMATAACALALKSCARRLSVHICSAFSLIAKSADGEKSPAAIVKKFNGLVKYERLVSTLLFGPAGLFLFPHLQHGCTIFGFQRGIIHYRGQFVECFWLRNACRINCTSTCTRSRTCACTTTWVRAAVVRFEFIKPAGCVFHQFFELHAVAVAIFHHFAVLHNHHTIALDVVIVPFKLGKECALYIGRHCCVP